MPTVSDLNGFATRCFRDTADQDYIAARMAFRAVLIPNFYWQALQAIEKYLKAILLYNRVDSRHVKHSLEKALECAKQLPFDIRLSKPTQDLIRQLDRFGRFRYLEVSYHAVGPLLVHLDRAVWEIRRYCRVLNHEIKLKNGTMKNILAAELARIERSDQEPPQKFKLIGGHLERILKQKENPARPHLIWQNAFYGRHRRYVRVGSLFHGVNAPLSLHPEMLEDVRKLVYLPNDVVKAFQEHVENKRNLPE